MSRLDLRHNTSLEMLCVHFLWCDPLWFAPSPRTEQDKHLASSLLAHIYSPHLQTLHFRIVVPLEQEGSGWIRCLDMRFLDSFAEPPPNARLNPEAGERVAARARGLRKVKLELRFTCTLPPLSYVAITEHIERQLVGLKKRNMLEIGFVPS